MNHQDYDVNRLLAQVKSNLTNGEELLEKLDDKVYLAAALIKFHSALESYLRASLISIKPENKSEILNNQITNWPQLLSLSMQYLGLSQSEKEFIDAANLERNDITHRGKEFSWQANELLRYANLVKKWCSADVSFHPGQPKKETQFQHRELIDDDIRPKQPSRLPLGCMWLLFLFLTPVWAIIILFEKNGSGFLKFLSIIYLIVLASSAYLLLGYYDLPLSGLNILENPSFFENFQNPFDSIEKIENVPDINTSDPKPSKTPYCKIIWENVQDPKLENMNRSMVWDEMVSSQINGSTLTYKQFIAEVLLQNPRLKNEDYVFKGNVPYKLPKCE